MHILPRRSSIGFVNSYQKMKILSLTLLALGGYIAYQFFTPPFSDSRGAFLLDRPMLASVVISGNAFRIQFDNGMTVAEALRRAGFRVSDTDRFYPSAESKLLPGTLVFWWPVRSIRIAVEGSEQTVSTTAASVGEVIAGAGLELDEDDLVNPPRESTVPEGAKVIITRVEIREEVKETKIPFVTKTEEDSELSWRKKIVRQKGENGVKTTTYRVSYHNGKEVNRKTLSTEVTKEPVTEVVTQGTYVKTGKSHRGAASWYAWTGTMAAANPWLPKGSYVRVTNMDNGKSVIVVINDRGPFVPGRIIDLDKVAFEKIASLGAGVINVKMEEIAN